MILLCITQCVKRYSENNLFDPNDHTPEDIYSIYENLCRIKKKQFAIENIFSYFNKSL